MECKPCDETMAGGFHPRLGVILCQNRFMSKKHMEDALSHELVHAWDSKRFKMKGKEWGDDLKAHACSEVTHSLFMSRLRSLSSHERTHDRSERRT